ncbi:MAG: HAMP domain-containing histidine kinase [Sphingomonas sp.]|nr:HAMP domain-containing histidine kinase [Sphingomonas sp.]
MLRKTPSLALRAGLIFISIYAIIFMAVLTVAALVNSADHDVTRHQGARTAIFAAANELREVDGSVELPKDGSFAKLAAKNPSLWLMGQSGERSFSFGPVPSTAAQLFEQYRDVINSARFNVPNANPPLRVAEIQRFQLRDSTLTLAAGGVDPTTLGARDTLRGFEPAAVLAVLAGIAFLGFLAMLIALPFFSRAIRPITAEAAALSAQDSGRRLHERKAPRELLPLVRAFNETLDRLAAELARRKRFITDVAHELRTPLAVVTLRVEALEEESAKQDLRRGVGRLTHLVGQMLDLERLSLSGQQNRPVDLVAVARDVLADLAPMAMKAGYEVSLDAPGTPVTVVGEEHAIARAITNLIGNSVAHAGGSGQIRVTVGAKGIIDVADEGPGIPPSLLPQLFEPFSRGSASAEGSGLGLHLTREIMRAHGGDVRLLPTEWGATFRLKFPPPAAERSHLQRKKA